MCAYVFVKELNLIFPHTEVQHKHGDESSHRYLECLSRWSSLLVRNGGVNMSLFALYLVTLLPQPELRRLHSDSVFTPSRCRRTV